jgi:predicted xylose isomerase-like sugar epimerase
MSHSFRLVHSHHLQVAALQQAEWVTDVKRVLHWHGVALPRLSEDLQQPAKVLAHKQDRVQAEMDPGWYCVALLQHQVGDGSLT